MPAPGCGSIRQALTALRDLLAPGGLFIAVEPDPNPLWDVVFGRAAGWWRGAGAGAGGSPLRSGEEWRVELAIAGFELPAPPPGRRAVAELGVLGAGADRPSSRRPTAPLLCRSR